MQNIFDHEQSFLNLIINVLLMVIAIFSVKDLIFEKSLERNLINKIKKGGKFLIIVAILSIGFNFCKDWNSESKQIISDRKEEVANSTIVQLQLSMRDSIIKKVDETYEKSIKSSNEALAKYNMEITDSLNSVVSKLKINAINPQLSIAPCRKGYQPANIRKDENGNSVFYIDFVSTGGTSYNVLIKCYLLEVKKKGETIIYSDTIAIGSSFITENKTSYRELILPPKILDLLDVMVFLTGSFSKDTEGKVVVPYNQSFEFNFKENKYLNGSETDYIQLKKRLSIK